MRTRYTVSDLLNETNYVQFTCGGIGYAVAANDYNDCLITAPYFKFVDGVYKRCYADAEPLNMHLRIEKQRQWFA